MTALQDGLATGPDGRAVKNDLTSGEQSLLDAVPGAIVAVDGAGLVNGWNASAEQLFGVSRSVILSQPLAEHVPYQLQRATVMTSARSWIRVGPRAGRSRPRTLRARLSSCASPRRPCVGLTAGAATSSSPRTTPAPSIPGGAARPVRRTSGSSWLIAQQAFHPVFQPIVELRTGVVLAYEALTRFDDDVDPGIRFADADEVDLGLELEIATLKLATLQDLGVPQGQGYLLGRPAVVPDRD